MYVVVKNDCYYCDGDFWISNKMRATVYTFYDAAHAIAVLHSARVVSLFDDEE